MKKTKLHVCLWLCLLPVIAFAQTAVTGTVVDAAGEAVVGANVLEKGTRNSAVTDVNGNFSLTVVGSSAVLQVSFLGYATQDMRVASAVNGRLTVTLQEDTKTLEEVVVTGIFNKPKEGYTGSAVVISSKDLEVAGNRSVLQSIRNIDPSFNIADNVNLGSDPNSLPTITMRGASSLPVNLNDLQADAQSLRTANQPLIIMNGFEISLERLMDMDENQIEGITLLKDASATAIYGTRASNGVLVVTTRMPKAGKLQITYKGSLNIEAPDLTSYNLMNAREKLAYEKAAGLYKNDSPELTQNLEDLYNQRKIDVERGVDTYWLKYPVRTGVGSRHSLNIEGGAENFTYGMGLSYDNVAGAMKGSSRDKLNGNVLFRYKVANVTFQNDLQIAHTNATNSPYGSFSTYLGANSYWTPYDSEGNIIKKLEDYTYNNNLSMGANRTHTIYNPLYNAFLPSKNTSNYLQFINNFSAEWHILPELFVRGSLGVSSMKTRSDEYISADNTMFDGYEGDDFERKGRYIYGTGESFRYEGQLTLNYSKLFNDVHQVFVGAGWTINEETSENYKVTGEGISIPNMDFLGMASKYLKDGRPTGIESVLRNSGFILNGSYVYNRRYFVDVSGKYEGSSQFGAGKRYAPFWSTGVGWNISNESFLEGNTVINTARLRFSYGVTGSQAFSPYQALITYQDFGGKNYQNWYGSRIMALGNEELAWQTTRQYNIGTEWELWGNRVKLNVDVYNKITDNLLANVNLPTASGFTNYRANVGEVENKGIEVSFNAFVLRNRERDMSWSVGGALVHNKNTIKKISNSLQFLNDELKSQTSSVNPSFLYEEGQSINTIYAVRSKGIDPSSGQEIYVKADGTETFVWDAKDMVACGVAEPKVWGTLNTTLRYKGIFLTMYFTYRLGGQAYNNTLASRVENVYPYNNLDRRALYERWKNPGDIAQYKSVADFSTTNATSRFVMKDNTFTLQTINLGYDFPAAWTKKYLSVSYLSVRGYLEDIMYLSTIERERGLTYPFSRKFSLALTVRF